MRNKLQEILRTIENTEIFLMIGFVILTLVIRGIGFNVPFERDEGEYAYSAWLVQNGGSLYKNAFLQKPPGIIYVYLVSQKLFGDNLWGPRLVAMLFVIATSLLTGLIAAKLINNKAFYLAIIITPVMLSFPYFMGLSANTEIFMITGLMGLTACFVFAKEAEKEKYWVMGAVCSVLAIMFKPIGIYLILYIYLLWTFRNRRNLVKFVGISVTTGIISALIMLAPIISVWSFFWEEVVRFNFKYVNEMGINIAGVVNNLTSIFIRWWVLLIFLIVYLIKVKDKLYFMLFITALLGTISSGVGHYYLIIMPFLALIAASGLFEISKLLKINAYYLGIITLALMLWPIKEMFTKTPNELVVWFYGINNPFYESNLVAQKLKDITDPENKVFIGGSEPQILYYAKRKSATRFVITYPMTIESELREEFQREAVDALDRDKPEVIIISNRDTSGYTYNDPKLPRIIHNYVDEITSTEYKLVGGYLWKNLEGGDWLNGDEISKEEVERASLVMYKKI